MCASRLSEHARLCSPGYGRCTQVLSTQWVAGFADSSIDQAAVVERMAPILARTEWYQNFTGQVRARHERPSCAQHPKTGIVCACFRLSYVFGVLRAKSLVNASNLRSQRQHVRSQDSVLNALISVRARTRQGFDCASTWSLLGPPTRSLC